MESLAIIESVVGSTSVAMKVCEPPATNGLTGIGKGTVLSQEKFEGKVKGADS